MKLLPLLVCAALALAVGVYAAIAGDTVGAPTVFLALGALVLGVTLYLLGRAGMSLLREPPPDEVRLATGRRRKELEREKQSLLKALKELEFDHEMHKISDGDYHDIAGVYRGRAIQVMRSLDESGVDYRKLVEHDLSERRRREGGEAGAPDAPDAKRRSAAASPAVSRSDEKKAAAERRSVLCAACETGNDADALFCKRCGKGLAAGTAP